MQKQTIAIIVYLSWVWCTLAQPLWLGELRYKCYWLFFLKRRSYSISPALSLKFKSNYVKCLKWSVQRKGLRVHQTKNRIQADKHNDLTHTLAELRRADKRGPTGPVCVCDLNMMVCGVRGSSHPSRKERQRKQEGHEKRLKMLQGKTRKATFPDTD